MIFNHTENEMKKLLKCSLIFVIAILFSTTVFAGTPVSSGDATMSLVKDEKAELKFGQYGTFEKAKSNIDTTNKTIDITLKVTNNEKPGEDQTTTALKAGEVVFLIDGSRSMKTNKVNVNGTETTREQIVIDAAKTLTDKLFKQNKDMKVGVVEFATSTTVSEEGTENDAKTITQSLVSSADEATKALETVANDTMGARTDLEAGLDAAEKLLNTTKTDNSKKYIITLTDAIPNVAIGVTPQTDGTQFTSAYDEKVFTPTKKKLTSLKSSGINVISLLINMTDDEIQISTMNPKPTYKEVAEDIFGTTSTPTAGPVYYVEDSTATTAITDSIYNDLFETKTVKATAKYKLTNIVIKDYIPQNYVDNFNFSYVSQPNIGSISTEIDKTDNSITWSIPELGVGKTATVTYRLSLKDQFDSDILNIDLPTNKNVTVDYKENGKDGNQVKSDKCPVVKLATEPKKEEPKTPDNIPKAGTNDAQIFALIIIAAVVGTISFVLYKKNNK